MTYPPSVRREFCERLGRSWRDLADELGVAPHERDRFHLGYEPGELWTWLVQRRRLADLAPALRQIGRDDLAALLAAGPADDSPPVPAVQPDTARRPTKAVVFVAAGCLAVGLIVAVSLVLASRARQPRDQVGRHAASPAPIAASSTPTGTATPDRSSSRPVATGTGRPVATSASPPEPATPRSSSSPTRQAQSPPFAPIRWIKVDINVVAVVPDRSPAADFEIEYDEVAPMAPATVAPLGAGGACPATGSAQAIRIDASADATICATTKSGIRLRLHIQLDPNDDANRVVRAEYL